jgi:ubiquitin-conjugating enzyme E2 W
MSSSGYGQKEKVLSRIAATRLQKELTEWQVNPPCGFEHKVTESLQRYAFESRSCLCHT